MLTNGNFATGDTTGWSFTSASATVAGGIATITGSGTPGLMYQGVTTAIGVSYTVRSTINQAPSGGFYAIRKADDHPAATNIVALNSAPGSATISFTATATTTFILCQVNSPSDPFKVSNLVMNPT